MPRGPSAAGTFQWSRRTSVTARQRASRTSSRVDVEIAELRSHSLRFAYRIFRAEERLADGDTRLACVDDHHLLRLPPPLIEVLVRGEVVSSGDAVC
jgi:hypothetical protein